MDFILVQWEPLEDLRFMFTFLKDPPIALQRMDRGDIGIEKTG